VEEIHGFVWERKRKRKKKREKGYLCDGRKELSEV